MKFIESSAVRHVPVLVEEVLDFLALEGTGLVVDCTVGLGGHAEAILSRNPGVDLLGIDRDREALALARERLSRFGERVRLVEATFDRVGEVVAAEGWTRAVGILADLGVSSLQLDRAERGFSFRRDGPLDMRMGDGDLTAAEVVATYSEEALREMFWKYGDERQGRRIARAVVEARRDRSIQTTGELRDLVHRAKNVRPGSREGRVDPATRVFQALRIEVNQELRQLEGLLDEVSRLLEDDGGRLVVISYHSLEDRLVKNSLRRLARGKIDEVTGRPHAETRVIEVLTKKPVRPSDAEVAVNPRARSARLRAARRL